MSWRTVIVNSQAKLDYKMGYLVVRGEETKRVLIDEIAILVLENPAISLTGCLLEVLTEKKVRVILCDSKRNPYAELTPHHGSFDSSLKIRSQFKWSAEVKSVVWQKIIMDKIEKQKEHLNDLGKGDEAVLLNSYICQVEPFDTTNREGHAAKVYFNALFGKDFSRSSVDPVNAALNYGYSMILSAFNREISANGYITQLGIFHDNIFNHFNLGSDLMEPYRIIVDREVISMKISEFTQKEKHSLWKLLDTPVYIEDKKQSVRNAIKIYTHSVLKAIEEGDVSCIKSYTNYCK